MTTANWTEIWGFWLLVFGSLGTCAGLWLHSKENLGNAVINWVEKRFRIHWFIQILIVAAGCPLLVLIGFGIHCVGNGGRPWPGYPLDAILSWW
jgi:hypothetical protein